MLSTRKNIIILGGGFGGIKSCQILSKYLDHKDYQIILIDRNKGQTYIPLLYEIGSLYGYEHDHPFHEKVSGLLSLDFETILGGRGINIIQAEVSQIDIKNSKIILNSSEHIDFSYLVIALGSVYNDMDINGVNSYAYPFKTTQDAIGVNDKIDDLVRDHFVKFHQQKNQENSADHYCISVNIVGGGPNGIEVACELASSASHFNNRHGFDVKKCLNFKIFEARQIFSYDQNLRKAVLGRLNSLNIDLIEGSEISQVNNDSIILKNGLEFKSDITIWTAGVRAPRFLERNHGFEFSDKKRLKVTKNMSIDGHRNVFGIGDCVDIRDEEGIPANLIMGEAISQANIACNNILFYEGIKNNILEYSSVKKSFIMPMGGKYAISKKGETLMSKGFMPYVAREVINLRYFLSVYPLFRALKLYIKLFRIFSRND